MVAPVPVPCPSTRTIMVGPAPVDVKLPVSVAPVPVRTILVAPAPVDVKARDVVIAEQKVKIQMRSDREKALVQREQNVLKREVALKAEKVVNEEISKKAQAKIEAADQFEKQVRQREAAIGPSMVKNDQQEELETAKRNLAKSSQTIVKDQNLMKAQAQIITNDKLEKLAAPGPSTVKEKATMNLKTELFKCQAAERLLKQANTYNKQKITKLSGELLVSQDQIVKLTAMEARLEQLEMIRIAKLEKERLTTNKAQILAESELESLKELFSMEQEEKDPTPQKKPNYFATESLLYEAAAKKLPPNYSTDEIQDEKTQGPSF